MVYDIYYGDIHENWEKDWSMNNPNDDPFQVLENKHAIVPSIGSGWWCFIQWADDHCSDYIQIDWGSHAWKCIGQTLIDLNNHWRDSVQAIDEVDPDKTYGVVFIEMS